MSLQPPSEAELREALCEVGRRVWQRGMVAANDGNFSVRLSHLVEGHEAVLCTPTGVSKGFMAPEEMVIVDMQGELLGTQTSSARATSEIRLHLYLYQNRPDLRAVVHAHPPHATAFALTHDFRAGDSLPHCVLPEAEVFLGDIPVAPYETPGTWAFAKTLEPFLNDRHVWLLASHGAVAAAGDLIGAYHRLEGVEHYCRVLHLARQLGEWNRLPPQKVAELHAIREAMGIGPLPGVHSQNSESTAAWCAPQAPLAPTPPAASDDCPICRHEVENIVREVINDHLRRS